MPKTLTPETYTPENGKDLLLKTIKKYDSKASIETLRGFHFANMEMFKGNRTVNFPNTIYDGKPHAYAEQIAQNKIKKRDYKTQQEKQEIQEVLSSEYKIHLMPKSEYIIPVVDIFLKACTENKKLASSIYSFKIIRRPLTKKELIEYKKEQENNTLPQIVIYLSLGKKESKKPGFEKELADYVLDQFHRLFAEYDLNEIAWGIPARYSKAITPLLSYSQGGGDVKAIMSDSQKLDFLSQEKVHYKLPDQHLVNPVSADLKKLSESVLTAFSDHSDMINKSNHSNHCDQTKMIPTIPQMPNLLALSTPENKEQKEQSETLLLSKGSNPRKRRLNLSGEETSNLETKQDAEKNKEKVKEKDNQILSKKRKKSLLK